MYKKSKVNAFAIVFTGISIASILLQFSVTILSLISCMLVGVMASMILASIIVKPKAKIVLQIRQMPYSIFLLFYVLNLVVLQITQVSYASPQLLNWNEIQITGYLRLFSSLLVIFFLPGLTILRILDLCKTLLEKIVFSFVISLFFTISVSAFLGFSYINVANLALLLFYLFFSWKHKDFEKSNSYLHFGINEISIIILASVILLGIFSNYMDFQLFIGPDTWRHHGVALALLENNISLGKYNFFHILLASIFYLSGFPYINLWNILSLFSIVLLLSLYLLFSTLLEFEEKKSVIASVTIWSFFSGFGGLGYYAYTGSFPLDFNSVVDVYLKSYMDVGYPFGFWIYVEGFWPQLIGFICLFCLIYLFLKESYYKRDLFLIVPSFTVGFTTHFLEVSFFVILYVSFVILYRKISFIVERILALFLAETLTLLISFAFAFVKSNRLMLFRGDLALLGLIYMTAIGLILLRLSKIAVINPKNYFSASYKCKIRISFSFVFLFLSFLILSLYVIGLLEWLSKISTFNFWNFYPDVVPWYIYPVRFGVAGILSIIGFGKILKFKGEKISFLSYATLFTLICSQIAKLNLNYKFFPNFTDIHEIRILFLLFVFISVWAGIGFSEVVSFLMYKLKTPKLCGLFAIVIVTFVFVSGVISTIQTIDFWALHDRHISREEIIALDYIRINVKAEGLNPIIAPSYDSYRLLQAFSGKFIDLSMWPLVERVFVAKTQQEFVNSLNLAGNPPPQYVYLSQTDINKLNNEFKGSFITELLRNSTLVYSNDEVKIYRISDGCRGS